MSFDLENFKKSRYCFIENLDEHIGYLDSTFELVQKEWDNPSPKIVRLTKENYTVYTGPSVRNVLYVSNIGDEQIEDITNFLIKSGIKEKLEELYDSNIGICNIRAYRFTHDPPREKTHYLDKFDGNSSFNIHRDGLSEGALKIMIFKSLNDDFVTKQHGALEISIEDEWIAITGPSPVCAIFSPNEISHRALQPAPDKIRDCIELTIIKRDADDFLVESSGAHAGNPIDLKVWNEKR